MGSRSTDLNRRLLGLKPPGRHGGLPGSLCEVRCGMRDARKREERKGGGAALFLVVVAGSGGIERHGRRPPGVGDEAEEEGA